MEYIEISDIKEYLKENIVNGNLTPFFAVKTTKVKARKGNIGEIINTFSFEGNHETTKTVLRNAKGEIDWVVTNSTGSVYVVDHDSFVNDYKESEIKDEYVSLKREKLLIQLKENIIFKNKHGNVFRPKAGHYIVVDDEDDFYELSPQSFKNDYVVTNKKYDYNTDDTYFL